MLFDRVVIFGDIHHGLKGNSHEHNQKCSEFIDWFITVAKKEGIDKCIFLGDWNHVRVSTNVSTMHYSLENLRKLNDAFSKIYFMLGNHDLYYKDNRDLNSVEYGNLFSNIQVIDSITTIDDVTFLPWLVKNEWKKISKIKSKYIFGHLELPRFKMNAMVEMPDNGLLQADHFGSHQCVISGHFHKRQQKGNIIYVGSPFPHNFADAWDDERGMMILEWGSEPRFVNFTNGPKYRTIRLSHLLTNPSQFIDENTHARITIDVNVTYEEMNYIKDVLTTGLKAKEISMISQKTDDMEHEFDGEIEFESVDQIVLKQLNNVESTSYNVELLVALYQEIEV